MATDHWQLDVVAARSHPLDLIRHLLEGDTRGQSVSCLGYALDHRAQKVPQDWRARSHRVGGHGRTVQGSKLWRDERRQGGGVRVDVAFCERIADNEIGDQAVGTAIDELWP